MSVSCTLRCDPMFGNLRRTCNDFETQSWTYLQPNTARTDDAEIQAKAYNPVAADAAVDGPSEPTAPPPTSTTFAGRNAFCGIR